MVKLSDAFKYNGTSSLTKFSELQTQCKNTAYFTSDRPINKLSSWEGYQCIYSASLSNTSISAAGETITVFYNIPYRSGITPAVTSTVGTVSNIVATDSSGNGTAKVTIGKNSGSSRTIKVKVSVSPGGIETYKELSATQSTKTVSSYGNWTFNLTANTSSIAATGGNVTFTISRPTRTVTYNTGETGTETATSGTFTLTRSNSTFTLSTSSISMTSSSLPTFTLSVGATGAAAVAAISSTVTASFTATSPTTGSKTASKTSESITRAASSKVKDWYKFSTFSVSKSSFTSAAGTATLSMVVQKQTEYTGGQYTTWSTITPASGTLAVTVGNGGSVGSITYGTTSTCTISVGSYTNSELDRTISISGNYDSGKATGSVSLTQTKDTVKSDWTIVSYGTPIIAYTNTTLTPAAWTLNLISSCENNWKRVWTSGKEETESRSVTPNVVIDKQYHSSSASATSGTTITRFSLSGSSLKHTTMGTVEGYDYVVVKATNPNDTSKIATQSFNVRNKVESYTMSYRVAATAGATSSGSTCTFEADLTSPADYIVVYGNCNTTLTTGSTSTASASCLINSYPSWASISNTNNVLYVTDNTGPERSAVIVLQVRASINGTYESKYFSLTLVQKGTGGQKFVGVLPMSVTNLSGSTWELKGDGVTVLTGGSSDMSISQSSYNTYINFSKIVDYIKSNSYHSNYTLRFTYYDGPYPTYFNLNINSSSVSSIKAGNDFEGYFYDSY